MTAPITTQLRSLVIELDDTITPSPWRMKMVPARATRIPTIRVMVVRTIGW
jgi:hypothetical protein